MFFEIAQKSGGPPSRRAQARGRKEFPDKIPSAEGITGNLAGAEKPRSDYSLLNSLLAGNSMPERSPILYVAP